MSKTSRLSFNLSDELIETLRQMADRNDTTMTEVLKRAIAVQKFLDDQKSQGNTILVEDPEARTQRELVLF